jgi:type IV secretory pathway VirB6-like protein
VYLTLLAYVTLAFLCVLTPLMAPLLIFQSSDNKSYTREFFNRWVNQIIATLFQPVFIIAYLSFAVSVMDYFIDGPPSPAPAWETQMLANSCPLSQTPPSTCDTPLPLSYNVQICPFKILFNNVNMSCMFEPHSSLGAMEITGDVMQVVKDNAVSTAKKTGKQLLSVLGTFITEGPKAAYHEAKQDVKQTANEAISVTTKAMGSLLLSGFTRLRQSAPLPELFLTLVTLCIITIILYKMMDEIPGMAQRVAMGSGLALANEIRKLPFEALAASMLSGAKRGVSTGAKSKGDLVHRIASPFTGGVTQALGGGRDHIDRKYMKGD